MCGFICLLSPGRKPLAPIVHAMTRLVSHRGPDGEGYVMLDGGDARVLHGPDTPAGAVEGSAPVWQHDAPAQVALGHRRLAIIDRSALGHQPMAYGEGRYWIAYNGMIYNHVELREELERLGHRFVSHTDTEVILAGYAQWGPDCLRRFNGMWAFVLVDLKARTLFAARDRFGVKPLYYRLDAQGGLAFASEIKAFSALTDWRPRVNAQRAWDFLVWSVTDHTDETLFEGVHQLAGGHSVLLPIDDPVKSAGGRLPTVAWYSLAPAPFKGSFEDAGAEFRRLLTDSVRLRLRADVPVGSCLSGGLDSSSLVCLMHELLDGQGGGQWTFSAVSDVAAVDESAWIDEVVRATGVQSRRVRPDVEGLFDDLGRLAWHQDEPYASSSIYAQWCVFRLAHEAGVKVMLDGQGADEQLAGYHGFMGPRLRSLLAQGRWFELVAEAHGLHERLGYSYGHMGQRIADLVLPDAARQRLRRFVGRPSSLRKPWLNDAPFAAAGIDANAASGKGDVSMDSLSLSLLTSRHLPMLLRWEDRNSMAHGLESRVPFLDWRLVEFNLSLPDDFKFRRGLTKRVLRSAMQGVLPERVRRRTDKIGFATPEQVWMRERATAQFRRRLQDAVDQSRGFLLPQAMAAFDAAVAGSGSLADVWRMISFGAWMQSHAVHAPG